MKSLFEKSTLRLLIIVVSVGLMAAGCSKSESSSSSNSSDYRSSESEDSEPENPYSSGSGHSAGYEWGEQHGRCGGSGSFLEGCEEYMRQMEEEE